MKEDYIVQNGMSIIDALKELAEGIGSVLVECAKQIGAIFFEPSTLNATGFVLTPIGYIALIGLVMGLVTMVFNWVTRIVKGRK